MISNLKRSLFCLLLFWSSCFSFSQDVNTEKVTLIEKQHGKRLELYAKNTDTISYVVFLRVTTEDFRRSSKRPVLKPIAPNSETHLLTLIKLAGTAGEYDHQFIVNEVSTNLKFRKDEEDMQINFDQALKTPHITIFESDNCNVCETTKALLNKNKIAFEVKRIQNHKQALIEALKKASKSLENIEKQTLIIQIESEVYVDIENKKQLLETLKNHIH